MESENQQPEIGTPELKLYILGSRQSDQFWLPTSHSHSKRPFCLTDVEQMKIQNQDDDEDQNSHKSKVYQNPLFAKKIFKIACGGMHSVVLTVDGQVFTFGCNDEGALGRRGVEQIPFQVALEDPIDLISAGDNHSMFANSANGAIYFSGNYNYLRGQKMTESIFQPTRIYASEINHTLKNKKIQKIASGNNHSCILINGNVFCRGEPDAFTIGRRISARHKVESSLTFNGVNLSHIVDIQCGGYHTIAKTSSRKKNKYYSWGKNDSGQLGIGNYDDQAYPTQIVKLRGKNIGKMAAGTAFSLFLTQEGQLFGCGSNQDGNLALGQDYIYQQSYQSQQESEQQQEPSQKKQQKSQQKNQKPEQKQQNKEQQPLQDNQQKPEKQTQQKPNVKTDSNLAQDKLNDEKQPENQDQLRKIKMHNLFIRSIRKIETPEPLENIVAGSQYAYGWNKDNLYSWGSGMGYILMNGQEQDQARPFQVKKKIINEHRIHEMSPGGLHAMFTSYLPNQSKSQLKISPSEKIYKNLTSDRKKLSRRRN